jgi:hypothetical protein
MVVPTSNLHLYILPPCITFTALTACTYKEKLFLSWLAFQEEAFMRNEMPL